MKKLVPHRNFNQKKTSLSFVATSKVKFTLDSPKAFISYKKEN